uniref:Uncharacterized protein n=1 Tax=Arion vulgaris TaxID=1028688 RepID=A0A0B7B4L7_9EUPU
MVLLFSANTPLVRTWYQKIRKPPSRLNLRHENPTETSGRASSQLYAYDARYAAQVCPDPHQDLPGSTIPRFKKRRILSKYLMDCGQC